MTNDQRTEELKNKFAQYWEFVINEWDCSEIDSFLIDEEVSDDELEILRETKLEVFWNE